MTTNVPSPTFGPTGFVKPTDAAILAGVQQDYNAALGGNLNPGLSTPQGQLASSEAAVISEADDIFLKITQNVDPAYSSGRMQDAIGRIYYLTRIPAAATVVTATCSGLDGTFIPINAKAQDGGGNIYYATESGTIAGGSVQLTFACGTTGPIICAPHFLSNIYQAIPGWDSVDNVNAGVLGNNVESRAAFELRRSLSVAINATGQTGAILANVLAVPGVLDAYALENPLGVTSGAVFTGSISGNLLTAGAPSGAGTIVPGQMITGTGIVSGTSITSNGSGTGLAGTYYVSIPQTVASTTITSSPAGVPLVPHSIYVAVYGGNALDVATAIFRKKNPGASYNGSTTVTVQDTNPAYTPPFPSYSVAFQIPTATPILFSIKMQNNANVPSGAIALVQAAVISAFNGEDGLPRARIAAPIFASRFYASIALLGSWALIYSIKLGIDAANQDSVLMRGDQIPTVTTANITVAFS